MLTPSNDSEMPKQILRILHTYKYGKTAMQAGMSMRRDEGVPEAEEILALITRQVSTVHVNDSEMRRAVQAIFQNRTMLIVKQAKRVFDGKSDPLYADRINIKSNRTAADEAMQLFAQHLQLAELKGRRDEAEKLPELVKQILETEYPDGLNTDMTGHGAWDIANFASKARIAALNKQIKGLE